MPYFLCIIRPTDVMESDKLNLLPLPSTSQSVSSVLRAECGNTPAVEPSTVHRRGWCPCTVRCARRSWIAWWDPSSSLLSQSCPDTASVEAWVPGCRWRWIPHVGRTIRHTLGGCTHRGASVDQENSHSGTCENFTFSDRIFYLKVYKDGNFSYNSTARARQCPKSSPDKDVEPPCNNGTRTSFTLKFNQKILEFSFHLLSAFHKPFASQCYDLAVHNNFPVQYFEVTTLFLIMWEMSCILEKG